MTDQWETEREEFEKWQQDRGHGAPTRKDDGYADHARNAEWIGWRRRAFLGRQKALDAQPPVTE